VDRTLSFFRGNKVGLVTVGTDLDNFAALKIYSTSGFYPVLFWSTWRLHRDPGAAPAAGVSVSPVDAVPGDFVLAKGPRLVSLLRDPALSQGERDAVRDWHLREGTNPEIVRLEAFSAGTSAGFLVLEKERAVSGQTGREIFRINDFFPRSPGALGILASAATAYCASTGNGFTIEMFVSAEDRETAKVLSGLSFDRVHDSVTLHSVL
jgi:hypothetical protein